MALPELDLLVLPYLRDFTSEQPGGTALYRELTNAPDLWVMRYEVDYRNVDVMPASRVWPFYRRGVVLRTVGNLICSLKLPQIYQRVNRAVGREP